MPRNLLLEEKIFGITSKSEFKEIALELYHFQFNHCEIYRLFSEKTGRINPSTLSEIPFLPISFFKTHRVSCSHSKEDMLFLSSGTTQTGRSKHFIAYREIYDRSFETIYRHFIGHPEDQVILALLPNYIEQGNSSLVYMVDSLIKKSNCPLSSFVLNDVEDLMKKYQAALANGKNVVIFGVSYALLDLAAVGLDLSKAIIIETGGMKGRRKEMTKEELQLEIRNGLNVDFVSSEYGMTELLSQSYSKQDGLFEMPNWMNILIRDINDPFSYIEDGKTGGINVIDLANIYSCSFIATQDLGKIEQEKLKIMGRFDNADIRGCNLLVQ
jgi:hypothetical protein